MVGGILLDQANGQGAAGSGTLLAADRRRIKADELAVAIKNANGVFGFVHHDFADLRLSLCLPLMLLLMLLLRLRRLVADVRYENLGAGGLERSLGIQLRQ